MKRKLTDRLLTTLAETGGPPVIWDSVVSGFGIRVGKHTVSYFACRRQRGRGQKPIRIRLGAYPLTKLAEAREAAIAALRDLAAGSDPRVREAERLQAEAAKQENLYRTVAAEFIKRHLAGKRTARSIEQSIRRELISRWGERPIAAIERADVIAMIDELVDRGHRGAAHKTFT
jgi:hypothetical protein